MSKKILFICAMKEEMNGMKKSLKTNKINFKEKEGNYYFKLNGDNCLTASIGITFFNVGKLTKLIHSFKPNLIVLFGSQAGLAKQKIGQVIVSNNVVCSDLDMKNFGYIDGTIDKKKNKSIGPLLCSGSHFMSTKKDKNLLKKRFKGVSTFDMETYMIFCVCREYEINFISMKAISDNGEENPDKSFEQNLLQASILSSDYALKNYKKFL